MSEKKQFSDKKINRRDFLRSLGAGTAGLFLSSMLWGCRKSILNPKPVSVLLPDQVWGSDKTVREFLANLYNRLPVTKSLTVNWPNFTVFDEAMWSGYNNYQNQLKNYPYDWWSIWDYKLVRNINQLIHDSESKKASKLSTSDQKKYHGIGRFLRAYTYFNFVTRMGGVPLVTKVDTYNTSKGPAPLQVPRAKESAVYDFVSSELDAAVKNLPDNTDPTKANKWMALSLKSRAMLYAGSIAKYNNMMSSPIKTPGGEVGIPASKAKGYYKQALSAAREVIKSGRYKLYKNNSNLGENFYEAIVNKSNNPEVIWVEDFHLNGKTHLFTYFNIPRSLREDNLDSSDITPSLNLVESFEYKDGSQGILKTRTSDGSDFIYYDNKADIFANKDPRLYGTVIYPGSKFMDKSVSIQAGVMVWNSSKNKYDIVTGSKLGQNYKDGKLMVGADGPLTNEENCTNSGFNLRKYLDNHPAHGERGVQSNTWWVYIRYAEVLLNAAEAAFELGRNSEALGYINQVRERAGIASLSSLSIEKIQHERRVELAFENHRWYDLKRWRLAHEVWNGDPNSPNTMMYALWPYRIVRPGDKRDGKYVFVKKIAPRFQNPRYFRMGNYYSAISSDVLSANPKIVKNPFH